VMVMLGGFYIFPPIWGSMGRHDIPELYANGTTDAVVISLPTILENKLLGQVLSGITSAGAFAAFMSTFSGLLVSMSGALAHDIYGKMLRPKASPESRLIAFKVAAVLIGSASMGLGLLVESFDITMMVGWAFAIAACSYFPLLLLGAWWKGLTKVGAGGGMLIGGLLALSAIVTTMLIEKKVIHLEVSPLTRSLMEQPAIWGVPLSIGLMVVLSKLTPGLVPADVNLKMLRLHAPEELGLSKNYIDQ
jgi:cation/acetate symporter